MRVIILIVLVVILTCCENRAINESEEFRPKEIHEKIDYHFDRIVVDGIEYLILSRDNNNPHEGFGFMAFRANQVLQKQDSLMGYLQAMNKMQLELYAQTMRMSPEEAQEKFQQYFEESLVSFPELEERNRATYSSTPR